MKPNLLLYIVFCFILIASGCDRGSEGISLDGQGNSKYTEADFKNFEFEDSHPDCQDTTDCLLMRVGGCMSVRAVHIAEIELAQAYTTYAKKLYPDVVCAPELPMEEYEALCLNRRCIRTTRNSRLLLEVTEQPVAGKPFWVGMSFRFPISAEIVSARFNLPEDLVLISGQIEWVGPVEALQDHIMWIQVQSNRAGELYLGGRAGIKQENASFPPLHWGKSFTVLLPGELTPQPLQEWIIATPTPYQ